MSDLHDILREMAAHVHWPSEAHHVAVMEKIDAHEVATAPAAAAADPVDAGEQHDG